MSDKMKTALRKERCFLPCYGSATKNAKAGKAIGKDEKSIFDGIGKKKIDSVKNKVDYEYNKFKSCRSLRKENAVTARKALPPLLPLPTQILGENENA